MLFDEVVFIIETILKVGLENIKQLSFKKDGLI